MQDSSQAGAAGQQLDAMYPSPPDYYSLFTNDNIQRLSAAGGESALEDSELKFLLPPPPPDSGAYTIFGRMWQVQDRLPSLSEQNIPQLYPEGPIDRIAELKRLNRMAIFEFLDLIDVLVKDPSQYGARTERIRDVFVNIHHLINEYRQHQAKETLKLMLREQIASKRQATEHTLTKCEEVERNIERLKFEATKTRAELSAAAASEQQEVESDQHHDDSTATADHIAQDGLAKIMATLQSLTYT
ncbi:Mediator of RNA polymerase II transcription subunit 7 [Coemansia guatemalensis]|uniref:Mediator of RNA polymerase II transcription subunit 7 n=1 Tax=Coemansia guatemalensis TaxID=2761395 RepID=A0A9W8HPD8_9FUNG|nr:Mediator of RNA polymerase II transcription subunit 7 [Coemansia guatemalensis]